MSIKLRIDGSVLDYRTGKVVVETIGSTVGECLNYMVKRQPSLKKVIFDKDGKLGFAIFVKVNGEAIFFDAAPKTVRDGDEIEIIEFTGG